MNAGEPIHFSRVKNKARKMKKKEAVIPQSSTELTLKDGSDYVLMEYSEEYPPIMMNVGMGALIQNYYRKEDDKDTFVPDVRTLTTMSSLSGRIVAGRRCHFVSTY